MKSREGFQILLVTPAGRDAELIGNVLRTADIESEAMEDIAGAIEVFQSRHVGGLLVAEEALDSEKIGLLASAIKQQPWWSAIPLLLLTSGGRESFRSRAQQQKWMELVNPTLLERPVRVATLVSYVKAALQMREAQYERRLTIVALRESEKLAAVGRLASSIAHEINNPLEAVTNLLYLLDETPLSGEQRGFLNTARQELARVSEIAVRTLSFNRERNIRGEASIAALLDSVLVLYQGRLADSKIQVERQYRNAPAFTCYPGELRQVFANLIGNSFDATRQGGRVILRERDATHPKTRQPGVRITLADTGHGMSEEVKAHLFEPFRSTKGNNGSGLGLWISKGIVEKHCGAIQVRSSTRPGSSGTVFSIFLPFDRRSASEAAAAGGADGFVQSNCA